MDATAPTTTTTTPAPSASDPRPPATYRAGIVGGGFMGRVHAHAVRAGGGRVVAVATSSTASARRFADEIRVDRSTGVVDELLALDDVDVVHVCTPNHLHHPVALAALRAGKHVVCEKPLATSGPLAAELVAAASDAGVVATVPFVYRFHPMVREARARVRAGGLGRVLLAHGSYLQDWMASPDADDWRVDPELGGRSRAFADIGSHWCDLLEFVTGDRIATLGATLSIAHPRRGEGRTVDTEDLATLTFTTEAGVPGAAVISQVSPGRKNRLLLEVSGTEGTLAFDQEQPELLWHGRVAASEALVRDPDANSPAAARYSPVPAGHPMGYQDCFNAFVADTAAAVAGDAPDGLPTFADGHRATRLVDAVLASAASAASVEVAP